MSSPATSPHTNLRRNFTCWVLDGTFWGAGFASLGLFTITPGMIHEIALRCPSVLPYENRLASLGGICFFGISQVMGFFVAGFYERLPTRKWIFAGGGAIIRLSFVALAICTFFMQKMGYIAYLICFFASLTWYGVTSGLVQPLWMDLISRMVPVNRRGMLIGARDSSATLIGSGVLALFPVISASLVFPANYTAMHAICLGFMWLSFLVILPLKETPISAESLKPPCPFGQQLRDTLAILAHDRVYRRLLMILALFALAGISNISLINMKGIRNLGLSGVAMTKFTSLAAVVLTISNAASVLTFGFLGDRWGYKRIAYVGYGLLTVALALAVAAKTEPAFIASILVSGMAAGAILVFMINFPVEFTPENRRPSYLSLRTLCASPFMFMPFVGGWIADKVGSNLVFVISSVFVVSGIIALHFGIHDPRRVVPEPLMRQDQDVLKG